MSLTPHDIARMLDHSTLQPFLTEDDIRRGCELALKYDTASVCARPCDVPILAEMLRGSDVKVCTVIGFPHGAHATQIKVDEARLALDQGCEELDHMQTTTTAICDWLEAHPESQPKTRRFAEYYIPTTLKLLHTYNDVQGQQGENAETIRRDIAGILHTLNQAYENLYNNLLSDVAMDISSEIAALQGMLANDGLTGREFE